MVAARWSSWECCGPRDLDVTFIFGAGSLAWHGGSSVAGEEPSSSACPAAPSPVLALLPWEGLRLPCSDLPFTATGTSTSVFKLVFSN